MKVAVLAGTLVDTKMGEEILISRGFEVMGYPLAKNPQEQTKMQYFSKEELEEKVADIVKCGKTEGVEKVFIYCNSLSSAIDYEKLEKLLDIPFITPLETYKNLDKSINSVAILAANGISAYKIDKIINEYNQNVNTISIGNLSIVLSIEENLSPKEIITRLNLEGLLDYFSNIKDERYKIDSILLGCTHFPYIKEELEKLTDLKIIDPVDDMINRLISA